MRVTRNYLGVLPAGQGDGLDESINQPNRIETITLGTGLVMIRYQLDLIGWLQFEQIIQSLAKAEFGFTESWGGYSDLGRDAYSAINLVHRNGATLNGPVLFQAKHVEGANAAGADSDDAILAAVGKECTSIQSRLTKKLWPVPPRTYILITNAPLNSDARAAIKKKINAVLPSCEVISWGANDVCDLLDNHPNVRIAFPQVLTYRDLTFLLNNRAQLCSCRGGF